MNTDDLLKRIAELEARLAAAEGRLNRSTNVELENRLANLERRFSRSADDFSIRFLEDELKIERMVDHEEFKRLEKIATDAYAVTHPKAQIGKTNLKRIVQDANDDISNLPSVRSAKYF